MAGDSKTLDARICSVLQVGPWNFLQIGDLDGGAQRLSFATGM
jgi:hypothetical protein